MLRRINSILLAALSCLFAATACNDAIELQYINQEAAIDSYINSQFKDFPIVRNEGSNRIVIEETFASDSLCAGDSLTFRYAGYVFDSAPSAIFYTNNPSVSDQFGEDEPLKILFGTDRLIPGLENGLKGVKRGEHSVIIFSGKYGFGTEKLGIIPPASALLYEVWIEKVRKN